MHPQPMEFTAPLGLDNRIYNLTSRLRLIEINTM